MVAGSGGGFAGDELLDGMATDCALLRDGDGVELTECMAREFGLVG